MRAPDAGAGGPLLGAAGTTAPSSQVGRPIDWTQEMTASRDRASSGALMAEVPKQGECDAQDFFAADVFGVRSAGGHQPEPAHRTGDTVGDGVRGSSRATERGDPTGSSAQIRELLRSPSRHRA